MTNNKHNRPTQYTINRSKQLMNVYDGKGKCTVHSLFAVTLHISP